jgi:hypothetical protein
MSIAPWTAGETEEGMKKMYRAHQWANITVNGINWFRPMGDARVVSRRRPISLSLIQMARALYVRYLLLVKAPWESRLESETRQWLSVEGRRIYMRQDAGHMLLAMTMRSERKESTNVLLCKNVFYIYVYDITYQCDALMRAYLYFFTMTHNQQHYYICMYFSPWCFLVHSKNLYRNVLLKLKNFDIFFSHLNFLITYFVS